MALKLPQHGFKDLVTGKSLKRARNIGEIRKDKFDEMSYLKNPVKKTKQKGLVEEAEDTARAVEQKTRMAQGAVAVPVAAGAAIGGHEYYKTQKKDKKILRDKAKKIFQAGESNVVRGMLHDPRFPLGAKLRILEGEGVIKTSSLWSAIKGTNYKAAKGQMDSLGKRLTETSKKLDEASGGTKKGARETNQKAEKAWEEARGKVWKEGFKTWSARIGLGGAAATPLIAQNIKEASTSAAKYLAAGTGAGATAGGITTALNPKLPDNGPTVKEIIEGSAMGGAIGLGITAAGVGAYKLGEPGKLKDLTKKGALDVSDIERRLGDHANLDEDKEKFVRRSIGQHKSDSFILKHPYLTGIPTLGLAPALKQHAVKDKIMAQLAKDSMKNEGDVYRLYIN